MSAHVQPPAFVSAFFPKNFPRHTKGDRRGPEALVLRHLDPEGQVLEEVLSSLATATSTCVLDATGRAPTLTQFAFLQDRSPLKLLCGGLGSGKTSTGARALVALALRNPPGTDTMMVAPTLPMLRRFMLPAFEQALPQEALVRHERIARCYLLKGQRRVWYGSASEPESLEGTNLVGFWGDEIRYWPERSWQNLNARRRDRRATLLQGIATSTPAMGWMEAQFNRDLPERVRYRIATTENEKNLAPGYVDELRRTYSERLCRSLIDGDFSVVEGQVYAAFDPQRHLVDWQVAPSLRTTLWMDFGVRRSSVLFAQQVGDYPAYVNGLTLPPHALVVFDELHPDDRPTERIIPLIEKRLVEHGLVDGQGAPRVDAIYCDPAGRARDVASGLPSVQLLQAAFGNVVRYQTDPRWTWVPNGVALVEGALDPTVGLPQLYFARALDGARPTRESNTARGVIAGLRGYRYPDDGGEQPLKDGFFEHAMDALRYGVVNAFVARGAPAPMHVSIRHGG